MISKKSISLVLSMFILMMVLAVPSGGVFQTAVAQSLEDDDDAEDELEQEADNDATTIEDSSADDNVLENENELGDDIALIDQDNEADEDAANVGVQDQDTTQTTDQDQDAVNANVDFDVQVGQQVERQPPPPEEEPPTQPPGTPGPQPEEGGVFCLTAEFPGVVVLSCFLTEAECEEAEAIVRAEGRVISECQRFEEPPPGAICVITGGGPNREVSCEGFGDPPRTDRPDRN